MKKTNNARQGFMSNLIHGSKLVRYDNDYYICECSHEIGRHKNKDGPCGHNPTELHEGDVSRCDCKALRLLHIFPATAYHVDHKVIDGRLCIQPAFMEEWWPLDLTDEEQQALDKGYRPGYRPHFENGKIVWRLKDKYLASDY